eukprot:GEMP01030716.1.p1 GENE.GEMP01030716.1~~GEMP01030716.1.p1  ORF type:complete len:405 (+),score=66.86 GEMP01030716.1:382-1596(+)
MLHLLSAVNGVYCDTGEDHHGRHVYKHENEHSAIYFWDERSGSDLCGWWLGSEIGGSRAYAYVKENEHTPYPPTGAWALEPGATGVVTLQYEGVTRFTQTTGPVDVLAPPLSKYSLPKHPAQFPGNRLTDASPAASGPHCHLVGSMKAPSRVVYGPRSSSNQQAEVRLQSEQGNLRHVHFEDPNVHSDDVASEDSQKKPRGLCGLRYGPLASVHARAASSIARLPLTPTMLQLVAQPHTNRPNSTGGAAHELPVAGIHRYSPYFADQPPRDGLLAGLRRHGDQGSEEPRYGPHSATRRHDTLATVSDDNIVTTYPPSVSAAYSANGQNDAVATQENLQIANIRIDASPQQAGSNNIVGIRNLSGCKKRAIRKERKEFAGSTMGPATNSTGTTSPADSVPKASGA